ncbi:uncharacterized protein LW94_10500 [Fusarium fujikuroi]|nr:uncharacterized protein LW94_10500 [Fusarium fujikuroi]SCN77071.1 uncharacterized protein FFE2_03728 [Fusarium fujikuroi]SCO38830.1 uncharacterized protein FFNC_06313 [Fusarium fujikuroi]SCV25990.1 uncharacterized protein FFB14_00840 [Fusarium fujikuroi]SCV30850.1 uncharacterized protein FFFS_02516 [Fusarium fujikuroi]
MVLTTIYWNLASSDHSSSSTSSIRWPVTTITGVPCSTFSPSASELLRVISLSQWLSFIRDVGFYEDRNNLVQSLKDNKARMQQFEVHAIDARLRSWASEVHNQCLNSHECYSVSCKSCMLRYLDEHASQAGIDDLTDPTTKVKDASKRPDNTDMGTSTSLPHNAITEDRIRHVKHQCLRNFMKVFSTYPPYLIVGLVFEQPSRHGYDELQKGYLACRMTWHTFKVNANPRSLEGTMPILRNIAFGSLPQLNMWGGIINDCTLSCHGHLTQKDLMNLHNLEDQAIKYLISHRLHWSKEIDVIQDFAGLKLSVLGQEPISELRDIIHTVNADLMGLVTAELEPTEALKIWLEMNQRTLYYCAKQNSKTLRQVLCDKYRLDTKQHLAGRL